MPDVIHLLSDDLANKIAAGEVVVRPAAVAKELLENAVDAKATEILMSIREGGKAEIKVVDNGTGMSPTDARMSFERHATSKITNIQDLFSIHTMGFRGEALPSIAAVSKVELKTKQQGETLGTQIKIEGAEVVNQEGCQCAEGTSITVKSLFYNVPARRKFLKSTSVETKHAIEEFHRIALANPQIKMQLYNNDRELYHLPAQSLHKRIAALFGKRMEERIVPVQEDTDIVTVNGFIGKPEHAKRSKGEQYFFVNQRFIRSAYLNHAVVKAYFDYIDPKEYPLYVLFLDIDPEKIDINVQPSKHEVKFEDEKHVYAIVNAAVKHALSKFLVTPTLDFDIDPSFNRHEFFSKPGGNPKVIENASSKPAGTFLKRGNESNNQQQDWQQLYKFSDHQEETIEQISLAKHGDIQLHEDSPVFQLNRRYIAVPHEQGFLLVDQRRAHQRIIYEQLLAAFAKNGFPSQKMLFPESVSISPTLIGVFTDYKVQINQMGFDLQLFGNDSVVVHASPAELQIENTQEFLESLLNQLASGTSTNQAEPEKAIAKHLAMYGAIRHGQSLPVEEMRALITQLWKCEQPNYGIRRDRTYLKYTLNELDKAFQL